MFSIILLLCCGIGCLMKVSTARDANKSDILNPVYQMEEIQ